MLCDELNFALFLSFNKYSMVFLFQIKFNIFMYVQQTGLGNVYVTLGQCELHVLNQSLLFNKMCSLFTQ